MLRNCRWRIRFLGMINHKARGDFSRDSRSVLFSRSKLTLATDEVMCRRKSGWELVTVMTKVTVFEEAFGGFMSNFIHA